MRESPAMDITEQLAAEKDMQVLVVEPHVEALPKSLEGKAELVDIDRAIRDADILVMLVNHREFKEVDKRLLVSKCVIDTRGVWS